MTSRILVIDDDLKLCNMIKKYGEKHDYYVRYVCTISDALELLEAEYFDIITLDIELEEENGLESLSLIKKKFDGPVLFVSCIIDADVILRGLQLGADDYLSKPFSFKELYLRIERNIKKASQYRISHIYDYKIDEIKHLVEFDTHKTELSENALKILLILLRNPNKIVSREEIYDTVWGAAYEKNTTRVIDAHISNIRKSINDSRLRSVRGKGYIFDTGYVFNDEKE